MTQLQIEKMPLPERLAAMESLWASLRQTGQEIPSPAWHQEVLAGRRRKLRSGNATTYTLAEGRKQLAR